MTGRGRGKAWQKMKLAERISKDFIRKEELAALQSKCAENARLLEMSKKDWKSCAVDLNMQLQLQEAQLEIDSLKRKLRESSQFVKPRDLKGAELRLLEKELAFEKKRTEHLKKVARFEKFRSDYEFKQIGLLELDVGSLANHTNKLAEFFARGVEDADHEKVEELGRLNLEIGICSNRIHLLQEHFSRKGKGRMNESALGTDGQLGTKVKPTKSEAPSRASIDAELQFRTEVLPVHATNLAVFRVPLAPLRVPSLLRNKVAAAMQSNEKLQAGMTRFHIL